MKYWRGYVVAVVLGAIAWALNRFAAAHMALVDMIYPYMTRLIQGYLAEWSASVEFCVWQMALMALIVLLLASIVVMILRKWHFVRWLGWVLAVVSLIVLLHTGLYGLNQYSGSLAEDVRLNTTEYTVTELIEAATYYRNQANALSGSVSRKDGSASYGSFEKLAQQAGEGFKVMMYENSASVLSGSRVPVKKLGWAGLMKNTSGLTVAITGEAAVNPNLPDVALPWVMCREMAHRMSIAGEADAGLAAYLTCLYNPDSSFQYTANLLAYHFCHEALEQINTSTSLSAAKSLAAGENQAVRRDLADYKEGVRDEKQGTVNRMCDQLVSWHIQYIVLPSQAEEAPVFDPLDPNQVDISDIPR